MARPGISSAASGASHHEAADRVAAPHRIAPTLEALIERFREEGARLTDSAWKLSDSHKKTDALYQLGRAHAYREAKIELEFTARLIGLPPKASGQAIADTSEAGDEVPGRTSK